MYVLEYEENEITREIIPTRQWDYITFKLSAG